MAYWLLGGAIFLLLFFSNEIVSSCLLKSLERDYLPVDVSEIKADAIVVLGGGGQPKMFPRQHPEVNEGGDRMLEGIRLFKQGAAPYVIVSGGGIDFIIPGQDEGQDMRELMTEFGLPDSACIVESGARNTRENGTLVKALMEERGMGKTILLVTSASHMPRSAAIFRKLEFNVIPAPTDYIVIDKPYNWFSLLPSAGNLFNSTKAIKEYIGIAVYGMLGWL